MDMMKNTNKLRFSLLSLLTIYSFHNRPLVHALTTSPSSSPISVAIIGGGVAGLSCAQALAGHEFHVTVFDTGRLRPGGRCSSRLPGDSTADDHIHEYPLLSRYTYDHAAQLISVPSFPNEDGDKKYNKFYQKVKQWEIQGALKELDAGSVYRINKSGQFGSMESSSMQYYYGTNGMSSIPACIMHENDFISLKQDIWVSPSNGVKWLESRQQWRVQAKGKVLGYYDRLVIAHNGKCADRLMSKTPAKEIHKLLRVNFNHRVPASGGSRMTLNSMYSLTVAVSKSEHERILQHVPPELVCAFVNGHPTLSFLTCQTRKYKNESDEFAVWTVLSTASFAKKHKVPQEFIPDETIETVSGVLLGSLVDLCGLPSPVRVVERRLQLWGAAVPLNVYDTESSFLYDANYQVGVVGDWLVEPTIAGAWTSGQELAKHWKKDATFGSATSVGLEGRFVGVGGATAQLQVGASPQTMKVTP